MSAQVEQMFASISSRYDAANDAISLGTHRLWRKAAVRAAGVKPGDAVLDCATGTGDLALAFKRAVGPGGSVVGTDFCADMLARAPQKAQAAGLEVQFQVADVLQLPWAERRFEVASISFGIRNVDDPARALEEMARVVKPGGRVVVLEFGQPRGPFGALFRAYSKHVMPRLGQWITGNRAAYEYLPRTSAAFPAGEQFLALMRGTGAFSACTATPLTFGTAWIYVGTVR